MKYLILIIISFSSFGLFAATNAEHTAIVNAQNVLLLGAMDNLYNLILSISITVLFASGVNTGSTLQ